MQETELRAGMLATVAIAMLAAPLSVAQAEPPTPAPLIQQIFVGSEGPDFIVINNPGEQTASLEELYLATVPDYYRLVTGDYSGAAADFLVQFPSGAVLGGQRSAVILLDGSASEFEATWGFAPTFSIGAPSSEDTAQMLVPAGGGAPSQGLSRESGLLVLFYWDQQGDLVQDADIVAWGDDEALRVSKTGVSLDGPDDGDEVSNFADETAAANQTAAPAPGDAQALVRVGEEAAEVQGGNGVDGVDETSEDLSAAFAAGDPSVSAPVPPGQVLVSGHVVPGARDPEVAGLLLEFISDAATFQAMTDEEGAYSLAVTAQEQFVVRISGPGIIIVDNNLTTSRSDLEGEDLIVDGVFVIAGVVQAAADQEPSLAVEGLRVFIQDLEGAELTLGADGVFSFELQMGGRYAVVTEGEGVGTVSTPVALDVESVTDLVIEVRAAFKLQGVVRDASTSAPIPGATIMLTDAISARSGDDGSYALMGLPPATYTVTVLASGYEDFEQIVELTGDQTLDVGLTAEVPEVRHTLSLNIQTSEGKPGVEAMVTVTDTAQSVKMAQADGAGRVEFPDLVAGKYTLKVELDGHKPLQVGPILLNTDASLALLLVTTERLPTVTTETSFCLCAVHGSGGSTPVGWLAALMALVTVVGRRAGRR